MVNSLLTRIMIQSVCYILCNEPTSYLYLSIYLFIYLSFNMELKSKKMRIFGPYQAMSIILIQLGYSIGFTLDKEK